MFEFIVNKDMTKTNNNYKGRYPTYFLVYLPTLIVKD